MGALEGANIFGIQIRESANDGSDFSNAASDYRILFVGEDGLFHLKDSSGTVTTPGGGMSDPMTTRGDMIYRNASNVTDRLAIPAAGQVIGRVGSDLGALYPPGYEFDYQTKTSNTSITATSAATADTVLTGATVTYDGSTIVNVQFSAYSVQAPSGGANRAIIVVLYDSVAGGAAASIGLLGNNKTGATTLTEIAFYGFYRFTPSAATHQLSIRAYVTAGTGSVDAGAGGVGTAVPCAMRVTKV